jgi:CRISPR-associated protein Csx10
MDSNISITFVSDWLVGSGLGDGHLADACLVRDSNGLLFLPGRAIKGALREAAHRLGYCREDLKKAETDIFGGHCQPQKAEEAAASFNRPGILRVGNGRLPENIERLLLAEKDLEKRRRFVSDLTVRRTQTAIDEGGVAKEGSLRTIECGLSGLTFMAGLSLDAASMGLEEEWLKTYLAALCAMVKGLGGHRARGLGYCRVVSEYSPPSDLPVKLPPERPVSSQQ